MGNSLPKNRFQAERMDDINPKNQVAIQREKTLYPRGKEARSEFTRDYTRILHSWGFRRLKHKTQVFFQPRNDHICTRLEHALHVASISSTICNNLGLNSDLANAIALGHDLGHAPFGHHGEEVLNELVKENIDCKQSFWHEKHSLRVVDKFETVKDDRGFQQNLRLTYGVRDGIICHCGEKDDIYQKSIYPRDESINLNDIEEKGKFQPFSWEGCVVKVSDIISYLGRDIEDAEICNLINDKDLKDAKQIINSETDFEIDDLSNGEIINKLIIDLIENSSPEIGLTLSEDGRKFAEILKKFNYDYIYNNTNLQPYKKHIELVLKTIFNKLYQQYKGDIYQTIVAMQKKEGDAFELFVIWLERYHKNLAERLPKGYTYLSHEHVRQEIDKIYDIKNEKDYSQAIVDYLAGFTDNFANNNFQQLISIV